MDQALWLGAAFGLVAGAVVVWWWMRGEVRAEIGRTETLATDRDRLRKRVDELQLEISTLLEGAARSLASIRGDAERALSERGSTDERVERTLATLSPEAGVGEQESADWRDGAVEAADQTAADLEARERALSAEIDTLQGHAANVADGLDVVRAGDAVTGERVGQLVTAANRSVDIASAMDEVIRRIQGSAAETHELSAKVNTEAERGYRAVHKTLDSIERIRDLTGAARERISTLGSRVVDIGHVVKVIHDITEKTNLLALNASIIAAQAGERGRSFAVVAQEIKALAQRTAASTKEINQQVRTIQSESERATTAMDDGFAAVGEGFQVAIAAGDALDAIRQSARVAQKRAQSMSRNLKKQSTVAEQVVETATIVADNASQLASAIRGQTSGSERLRIAALDVHSAANRIADLVREHGAASERRTEALREVVDHLTHLSEREREVHRRLGGLRGELSKARDYGDELAAHWGSVADATARLRESVARLRG